MKALTRQSTSVQICTITLFTIFGVACDQKGVETPPKKTTASPTQDVQKASLDPDDPTVYSNESSAPLSWVPLEACSQAIPVGGVAYPPGPVTAAPQPVRRAMNQSLHYILPLQWAPVEGALTYEIKVLDQSSNNSSEISANYRETIVFLKRLENGDVGCGIDIMATTGLDSDHYHWQARGLNVSGAPGPWSEVQVVKYNKAEEIKPSWLVDPLP